MILNHPDIYWDSDVAKNRRPLDFHGLDFMSITIRTLCASLLGLLTSVAGWTQTIAFPSSGTTTASGYVRITIAIPAGVTQVRVEVFGTGMTPISETVLKNLTPGSSVTRKVFLASGATNTISVSNAANPTNRNSITVIQNGNDSDDRGNWEASGYVGASIDSFAANETKQYLGYNQADTGGQNLQQASGPQTGYVAGVDFSYRLLKSGNIRFPMQLWLFGETTHGQRSTEVDCNAAPETCKLFDPTGFDPSKLGSTFFAILRNSSSLEGYAGARFEFLKLNPGSSDSANLYLKSQLGFITVQKNGSDIADDHLKIGVGAIMTNGLFKNSYLEMGYGKSDLFAIHRGRRFKVDGYLEWQLPSDNKFARAMSPFVQLTVDSDFGPGSDSVRVYYGLNVDIKELFR